MEVITMTNGLMLTLIIIVGTLTSIGVLVSIVIDAAILMKELADKLVKKYLPNHYYYDYEDET